ncbi:MAG: group II intron reverse transcriptase/maturase [Chloroflexota bacterium]
MSTVSKPVYEWNTIPWRAIEQAVFKLQKRIYQASQQGNSPAVHALQRLLMKSQTACLLAVRRVTQDNAGKKTAGVDGVKSLTPHQRLKLADQLQQNPYITTAPPVRRVWIPKKNTDELRPLGIPVMEQRARQALAKLALEPEWEARFEPNSYGYRPGRSAHDAIEAIFKTICHKAKYVLDADVAQCFDRINQTALLEKLHTYPQMRQTIQAWLQAGIMDGAELFPSTAGTPQGSVISTLLANVALHGLETAVAQKFARRSKGRQLAPKVVRFADDFVVIDEDETVLQAAKEYIADWLATLGLELKPSKTRITHTLQKYEGPVGFDFLGFHIQQFKTGKGHSGKRRGGIRLGFKTLIRPSKEAIKRHIATMGAVVNRHKAVRQADLIRHLNPQISGWANYYASVCSKAVFNAVDHYLVYQLLAWTRRRHATKSKDWRRQKYWCDGWSFSDGTNTLHKHTDTAITRHVKVAGNRSVFDGAWVYWASRMGRHPEIPKRIALLLKRQKGSCPYCGLYFRESDAWEQDHSVPKRRQGSDGFDNRQLLHKHCHDQKTATETRMAA